MIVKVVKQMRLFPFVDLLKQVVSRIHMHRENAHDYQFCTYLYIFCLQHGSMCSQDWEAFSEEVLAQSQPPGLLPLLLLPGPMIDFKPYRLSPLSCLCICCSL